MGSARLEATIDAVVKQEFKRQTPERGMSNKLEELMRQYVELQKAGEQELMQRKEEVENQLEEKEEEIEDLKSEKLSLESELEALQLSIEEQNEQEQVLDQAVSALSQKWRELRRKTGDPEEASND